MSNATNQQRTTIPVVRRSQAYLVLSGVVVGMLAAGLAVPMIFGESVTGGGGGRQVEGAFELPEGSEDLDSESPGVEGGAEGGADGSRGDGTAAPGGGGGTAGGPGTLAAPGAGTAGSGGGAAPQGLRATDRGVSADTIKVGAVLLDVATVGRLGVAVAIDPAQQQAAFQAFFDEINARGGINGRQIEGHYRAFDVTDRNDQIAACRELTQEKQVFAILAGFNTVDPTLCIVEENKTPLVSSSGNNPDWVFERAQGRLFSMYPGSGRMMASLVSELERVKLADKKIGIMSDGLNDPGGRVAQQLEGLLEARNHEVVYRGQLSDDIPTASSQVPVEVNRMQTAGGTGAEVVIFLSSNAVYGTQFVNQASRQGYHPTYVNSDWASNNGDTTNQNMPEDYEGAISFTFNRGLSAKRSLPPTPINDRCRDIYNARSGRKLAEPNRPEYGLTMSYCDDVRAFEILAAKAGPELTRDSFSAARTQFGLFESAAWSNGTYDANRFDMADLVRTQRWTFDCKCWNPVDGFHRPGG